MVSDKLIKQTKDKFNISLKDATCVLLMDGFFDSLTQYAKPVVDKAR